MEKMEADSPAYDFGATGRITFLQFFFLPVFIRSFFPPIAVLFIDDMGIGGQAKQLLHQGMKNKPNTNTHEANQTQTPLKAKSTLVKSGKTTEIHRLPKVLKPIYSHWSDLQKDQGRRGRGNFNLRHCQDDVADYLNQERIEILAVRQ